ncbi:GNAT family N-acetyltransferase [Metabacillus arenae]|uniref:GNAT family N-acetyltransferase n=1 Tax=Metabacillus arenae TaxID=2771434 RepID=A0A926NFZ1_9BACI|nr:GNAT family N-acetyltransferase [Metabacillus arenae]MBD1379298.1 GNAT family N-acetyltransferase [Metabacillus arenae]
MYIKKATIYELDILSELFNQYRVFYHQKPDIEGAREFLNERIINNESVIFLAVTDKESMSPMGFVQLYPIFTSVGMNRKWLLNDLFVTEKERRKGAAKNLMNAAKEFALETGASGLLLETGIENVNAQALYESLGYKREEDVYFYNLALLVKDV